MPHGSSYLPWGFFIYMTREEALLSVHKQVVTLLFDRDNPEALRELDAATKVITGHVAEIYARQVKRENRG